MKSLVDMFKSKPSKDKETGQNAPIYNSFLSESSDSCCNVNLKKTLSVIRERSIERTTIKDSQYTIKERNTTIDWPKVIEEEPEEEKKDTNSKSASKYSKRSDKTRNKTNDETNSAN